MSEFSDYLKELIHSKENISTNSLIKYCNIDRSTMYKIINGTRRPPKREIFIKMAKFFQLTPSEYQKFLKTYQLSLTSPNYYYRRKSVEEFLIHFPDICSVKSRISVNEPLNDVLEKNLENTSCFPLHTEFEINHILRIIFAKESSIKNGLIQLLLQPNNKVLFSLLASMNFPDSLEIRHIFCLNKTDSLTTDNKSCNLEYLKTIFPLYSQSLYYQTYCFYDNVHSHFYNMNIFPYLILTTDYAVSLSSDFQSGIFFKDINLVSQFHKLYNSIQEKCFLLFQVSHMTPKNLSFLNSIAVQTAPNYILQPESCFTPFISEKIIENALRSQIPNREQILPMIKCFFKEAIHTIKDQDMHIYFTENGIEHFIYTGCLCEIPYEFARPFLPEERLLMLKALLPYCLSGHYHLLKKPLDQLPINLHLCVNTQSGYLSFENSNGQTMYLLINEPGFLSIFIDYIENLNNEYNSYIATPEETANFIKKEIEKLEL